MKFTWRIMLSYICLSLLPGLLVGVYIYFSTVKVMEKQAVGILQEELEQKTSDLERKLNEFADKALNIASNPVITEYLNNTNLTDLEQIEFLAKYFIPFTDWMRSLDSLNFNICFYTDNKTLLENEYVLHTYNYSEHQWFQEAATATMIQPVWQGLHEPRKRAYHSVETRNVQGNKEVSIFVPVLTTVYEEVETLLELYFSYEVLFNDMLESEILKGNILVMKDIDAAPVLDFNGIFKIFEFKLLPRLRSDTFSNEPWIIHANETSYYCYSTFIPQLGYTIFGYIPAHKVMKNVQTTRLAFLISLLIGIVALLSISLFLSKRMTRKVDHLVKAMRRIQEGQLDFYVPIEGDDEFAELAKDFNIMIDKIRYLIDQVYKSEILHKEAMIKSLVNQINPHFLYNTLETIKMMAETKRERAISDALTSLGTLLRYNLRRENDSTTLEEELNQVKNYLRLQNLMFDGRLELDVRAANKLLKATTINLLIQPIVENAILHGFENATEQCRIIVDIASRNSDLTIKICDNGSGMSPERLDEVREWIYGDSDVPSISLKEKGIGLRNVQQRIELNYGKGYGLKLNSSPHIGTEVSIILPVNGDGDS